LERSNALKEHASKQRLFWGLHLLKSYNDEHTSAAFCGNVDEGTFAQWAWFFITEISYLESFVILWENRRKHDIGNTCMASVDGADFRVKGKKMMSGSMAGEVVRICFPVTDFLPV